MPNRLAKETSPYLLQHADNPVDWYPWGEEALQRAREEDKPVLLSIGYSACHWCHVMEHESFENQEFAHIMNENFINIKVDREERPDLDSIYMQVVQAMTGRGGWPMTVFLTPDGKPFYSGTYFPPEDRHGMPGFPRVLRAVADAYKTRRAGVVTSAEQILGHLRHLGQTTRTVEPLQEDILHEAFGAVTQQFEPKFGGFGSAPKFPQPMTHEFLLQYHHRTKEPRALAMVEYTLEKMARGGMYDQLGGGFHRYSTDPMWLVPHFEKMLYDNALLARLYLHAYQATGKPFNKRTAQEVLDYTLREMTDPSGGFYSTQDADSEGEEGKYYLWTPEEIKQVVGKEDGEVFCQYYGVTEVGNFEGRNILHVPQEPEAVAKKLGVSTEQLLAVIERAKKPLLQARSRRVPLGRDEKVLTAWNGLMLRAFAEAACVLNRDDYAEVARRNASFILGVLRSKGRLLRTYKDGQAKLLGYLEDYAFLIDGLLALYEATFERRWLDEARSLADAMVDLFWDEGQGAFFDVGKDHEKLVIRPRDFTDNATPCGSSVAVDVLLHLAVLTGNDGYTTPAVTAMRGVQEYLRRYPTGMGHWLCALDFYLSTPKEVAIVGRRSDPATRELLRALFGRFLPNKVVAGYYVEDGQTRDAIPLLQGKSLVNGRAAAYVCQHYTCQAPVTTKEGLEKQLSE